MSYFAKFARIAGGLFETKGAGDAWTGQGGRGPGTRFRFNWQETIDPAQAWKLYRSQTTLWAGIRMIAEAVSSLPWGVDKRRDRRRVSGGWKPVEGHELEQLIEYPSRDRKGRWTRKRAHRYNAMNHLICGNSLTRIGFVGGKIANHRIDGKPAELYPIALSKLNPQPKFSDDLTELVAYEFKTPKGAINHWLPEEIIQTMLTDDDPYWGRGIPQILQRVIATDTRALEWQAGALDRGRPSFAWKDASLVDGDQINEVREQLKAQLGDAKSRDPIVIGSGGGVEKLFESAVEMDLINGRREIRAEVAQVIGLLPTMFSTDPQAENNLRAAVGWLWDNAALPLADEMRDAYNTGLVPIDDRRDIFITYRTDGVEALKAAMVQKLKIAAEAIGASIPPNEAYQLAGLGANIGELGDEPLVKTTLKGLRGVLSAKAPAQTPPAQPGAAPADPVADPSKPSDTTPATPAEDVLKPAP